MLFGYRHFAGPDLTEVYLYSDYPGTVSPVKLTVGENGAIAYDQKQVRSRAGNPLTLRTDHHPDRHGLSRPLQGARQLE